MTPLLQVKNLKKYYRAKGQLLKAVDDVSFDIHQGETLGLVGESGCGKSTIGKMVLNLIKPSGGEVSFKGELIQKMNKRALLNFRKSSQIIFQDPFASLDPRMTVGDTIAEALNIHKLISRSEKHSKLKEIFDLVRLHPSMMNRFPHEFSGGQRQRVTIARALAVHPEFIVCDEAISALDVSIQAQIIELLLSLQKQFHLTYLFIAHDLAVVKHISDKVAVMYLGQMMELASKERLFASPSHPYTQALLSAVPNPDPIEERKRSRIILKGDVPSPKDLPKMCPFSTRCPKAKKICFIEKPQLKEIAPSHFVACHLH